MDFPEPDHEHDEGESSPGPDDSLRRRLLRIGVRAMELEPIRHLLKPLYDPWYHVCVECGGALGEGGDLYCVERAVRHGEPLFEYALCETCLYRFQDDLSRESTDRMSRYWLENFDVDARQTRVEEARDASELVRGCAFTGRSREELEEYQIWAWFQGEHLVADALAPALICPSVMEDMQELLSRKTRDRLDDFIRDRLGLPPELQRLPVFV